MRFSDKVLRRNGLVRVSALPMRDFTVSYHHPRSWGEPVENYYTIDGVLRGGQRVTGALKLLQSPYGDDRFTPTGRVQQVDGGAR